MPRVDDEAAIREVTSAMLAEQGYEILTAEDGLQALELLPQFRPHLVVTDLRMPRMTGFEVLESIKSEGPLRRIPIVIVSSSNRPQDINRAYELGANAYMIKPMDFRAVEHLFESITHYWGLECAKPELEVLS